MMNRCKLEEAPGLEHLLKLTPGLKWNFYIRSMTKEAKKMVCSLSDSRKFLTPPAMFSLCKRTRSEQKLNVLLPHWSRAVQSSLSRLDQAQKHLNGLVGDELFCILQCLSHRKNAVSLLPLDRYLRGRCSFLGFTIPEQLGPVMCTESTDLFIFHL